MISGLVLAAAAFAGEVTIWHAYRGGEREALESLAATWQERHPGVTVLPVFVPSEALADKLQAAVPHGSGPDLFVYAQDRIADWSDREIILPVPAEDGGWHPVAVEALTFGDQRWGWPLSTKCAALFYNRALVPEPPGTTDALVALARSLTREGRYGLVYEVASAYHNAGWLHGFGGGVFAGGGGVALDHPANIAAYRFIQDLALSVVPSEPTGALVTQMFNEGRAAMTLNGPWFLAELDPALSWGVAPLPVVSATGLPAAPYVSVEAVFLARRSGEAEALGAWLAADEAALLRQEQGRQVVASVGVPVTDPALSAFRGQLDHAVPLPTRAEMPQTWEPLARALRRLTRGAASPEAAASEAQSWYKVLTRPSPEPASPWPYLGVAALALAGVGWRFGPKLWAQPLRQWAFAYVWVAPAFLGMTLLTVLPFILGAAISLYDDEGTTFVGVSHFLDILLARDFPFWSPMSFWATLLVTLTWTLANVALHVGLGVTLAMLLREPWVRMRGVFRALLILPWAVPSYITALIWKGMFHKQFGAINALLALFGVEPVSWFASFSTAFAANLATNTWLGFPFMMVVTLGAHQSIPRDLEEAAALDGADGWQRFRHVTLPLLKPALLPAVILGSVWTFNMFNIIFLVSGGEPDGSTDLLISQAYRWAFTRGHRYGYAAAYAVIIFGVLVIYGRVANRLAGRKVL